MDSSDRWEKIRELGRGGQGTVYLVKDRQHQNDAMIQKDIRDYIRIASTSSTPEERDKHFRKFIEAISSIQQFQSNANKGALKELNLPEGARDPELAFERIKREIQTLKEMTHPSFLEIIDVDPESAWFVSKYYAGGTLIESLEEYQGNLPEALRAIRPVVEGVAELHNKGIIHRDIKPHNVFIDELGNLILGDFGIVFFDNPEKTRISRTIENVGSRDWMPAWAMGMMIENIRPAFDVFSLGKLLWSMVSGKPILQLWYYEREQFNVEALFPKKNEMPIANELFKKCIVENEEDCLQDANALLEEIDKAINMLDNKGEVLRGDKKRICKVCGRGNYVLIVNMNNTHARNFGIEPTGSDSFKIFYCDYCGHSQLFYFPGSEMLEAWE